MDHCGSIPTERNRFFTGKYMTARDFDAEQDYLLSRQHLHNRLMHGWGIVCGLRVEPHPKDSCKQDWVIVKAGVALDCCGREIYLPSDTAFEVPMDQMPPVVDKKQKPDGLLLCIRYGEQEIEQVPVLYAENGCNPNQHEANRLKETPRLEVRKLDEVGDSCWRIPDGDQEFDPDKECIDDCGEQLSSPAGGCINPVCACAELVPLALLVPMAEDEDQQKTTKPTRFEIDLRGRRHLPVPIEQLTRVVGINWPHGGEVCLEELRDESGMGCKLKIHFNRKLIQTGDSYANGINEFTFVAQYGGAQKVLEFVPAENPPDLEQDGCTAVFHIDPEYLELGRRHNLAGTTVYVTLRCDFILDCHEMPVDGNHLAGRLPSGNGLPGGDFVSWFNVVHEHSEPDGEEENHKDE